MSIIKTELDCGSFVIHDPESSDDSILFHINTKLEAGQIFELNKNTTPVRFKIIREVDEDEILNYDWREKFKVYPDLFDWMFSFDYHYLVETE